MFITNKEHLFNFVTSTRPSFFMVGLWVVYWYDYICIKED